MSILIELTGPASSGKTTLARELAERNGWFFVGEPIKTSVAENINTEDKAKDFQLDVLENHYDNLMMAFSSGKTVITDRCILDLFIYALLFIENDEQWLKDYSQAVSHAYDNVCKTFEDVHTFKCESIGFKDNGIRTDEKYDEEKMVFDEHCAFIARAILPNKYIDRIEEIERRLNVKTSE